jgi:LmbE family N-acetylglucosaminyl deacetylase
MIRRAKTVLVIVAHADDMEFMAGGSLSPSGPR